MCESREKDGGTKHDEPHVSVTSLPYSWHALRGGGSCSHYEQHSGLQGQYVVVLAVYSGEEQTKQTGQECSQSLVCQHPTHEYTSREQTDTYLQAQHFHCLWVQFWKHLGWHWVGHFCPCTCMHKQAEIMVLTLLDPHSYSEAQSGRVGAS